MNLFTIGRTSGVPITLRHEDDVWLVATKQLHWIQGDEYLGEITNYATGEVSNRLVALIEDCMTGRFWWVDTTTGSVYNTETGKGFGPRTLKLYPEKTGRQVPDIKVRQKEAEIRYLNSQTKEDDDGNSEISN